LGDEAVAALLHETGMLGLHVRSSNAVVTVRVRDTRLHRARDTREDELGDFKARAPALYADVARHLRPR
jgi:hypothetical protein